MFISIPVGEVPYIESPLGFCIMYIISLLPKGIGIEPAVHPYWKYAALSLYNIEYCFIICCCETVGVPPKSIETPVNPSGRGKTKSSLLPIYP